MYKLDEKIMLLLSFVLSDILSLSFIKELKWDLLNSCALELENFSKKKFLSMTLTGVFVLADCYLFPCCHRLQAVCSEWECEFGAFDKPAFQVKGPR